MDKFINFVNIKSIQFMVARYRVKKYFKLIKYVKSIINIDVDEINWFSRIFIFISESGLTYSQVYIHIYFNQILNL